MKGQRALDAIIAQQFFLSGDFLDFERREIFSIEPREGERDFELRCVCGIGWRRDFTSIGHRFSARRAGRESRDVRLQERGAR